MIVRKTTGGRMPGRPNVAAVVADYVQRGLTYKQMAAEFERTFGVTRTWQAFQKQARELGLVEPEPNRRHDDYIPWAPILEHHMRARRHWYNLLIWLARTRKGSASEKEQRDLRSRAARLKEMGKVSIDYDPQTEDGFVVVPRESWHRCIDQELDIWIVPPGDDPSEESED